MAERRMLTRKVTDDDHFINLSSSAQALYLHLSMSADDDGFCNQITSCMFRAHASVTDLKALLDSKYLIEFENGVIVIKHWRMANSLRKDRHTPTAFQEELARLTLKDNGTYTLGDGCQMVADWLPDGCQMGASRLPQNRVEENRLEKNKEEKKKKGRTPKLSNLELFENLIAEGEAVKIPDKVKDWLGYKTESGFTYTKSGLRGLLRAIVRNCEQSGPSAVSALIDECIEKGWKGIIWDRLKKPEKPKGKQHNFEERTDDLDEMALQMMRQSLVDA